MSTSGPTAIQVSPTEEAMKLSAFFSKAAEAILNASSMPQTIAGLEQELSNLRQRFETSQTHGQELDNALRDMREQRNNARNEVEVLRNEVAMANRTITDLREADEGYNRTIEALIVEVDDWRKIAEGNGMKALELEDELDTAKAKLAKIEDQFRSIFGSVPKAEPEAPKPTPVEPVQPAPLVPSHSEPAAMVPEPIQAAPTEPPPEADWNRPTYYSNRWGRYVNDEWRDKESV